MKSLSQQGAKAPIYIAFILLIAGGFFMLTRADAQARDTVRKHHLEDLELALYYGRNLKGTFPPYDQQSWCGVLTDEGNEEVLAQVEEILRAQNNKYANEDKPFPRDPIILKQERDQQININVADYFYWKRSPAAFDLYSILEMDDNNDRTTYSCASGRPFAYDYGISSIWREHQ